MHWVVKHKARAAYYQQVAALLLAGKLPPIPLPAISKATIRASMVLGAEMDDDNAVARCKWALDALVRLCYLSDDRRKVVRWEAFPEQRVSRKEEHSLTLVITPVVV